MSIEKQYVSFNDDFTDWQYASGVIIPKQRGLMIENITIISLVLEPAETYSYDSKGNPIAATDGSAKTASEFFADSRRLKSCTTPGGEPPRKRHRLDTGSFQNLQHSHRYGGYTNWVNE